MLWEWAAAAAAVIVAVLFCLRLTRQGLGTLEEERDRCLERIREMDICLSIYPSLSRE